MGSSTDSSIESMSREGYRCVHQMGITFRDKNRDEVFCDITRKKCRHPTVPEICRDFDVDNQTLLELIASNSLLDI